MLFVKNICIALTLDAIFRRIEIFMGKKTLYKTE